MFAIDVPCWTGAGPPPDPGSSDFIVRFPLGATIDSMQVVSFDATDFFTSYGQSPTYEMQAQDGSVDDMTVISLSLDSGITNTGEGVVLFYWEGASDLVSDVEMVNVGTPSSTNRILDKTGLAVDGPDADSNTSVYLDDADAIFTPFGFAGRAQ